MQITAQTAEYTRWLLNFLGSPAYCKYIFLSNCLNNLEFYTLMSDDGNRASDGLDLRDKYADEYGEEVLDYLPEAPSVLEVLAGMAIRADSVMRKKPYTWLIIFYDNLGFDFLSDSKWTQDGESFVISTIHKWLDRRFPPSGNGTPFRNSKMDLTKVTMWNSLQWYLADEFGGNEI